MLTGHSPTRPSSVIPKSEIIYPTIIGIVLVLFLPAINSLELIAPEAVNVPDQPPGVGTTSVDIFAVVDATVSMLVTAAISVFVLMGFFIKLTLDKGVKPSVFLIILVLLFTLSQIASINFGYLANVEFFYLTISGVSALDHILGILAMQAAALYVSFCILVAASAHVLLVLSNVRSN
jgi:hypothetical protein